MVVTLIGYLPPQHLSRYNHLFHICVVIPSAYVVRQQQYSGRKRARQSEDVGIRAVPVRGRVARVSQSCWSGCVLCSCTHFCLFVFSITFARQTSAVQNVAAGTRCQHEEPFAIPDTVKRLTELVL